MFGQAEISDFVSSWRKMAPATRDALLIFGAITVVVLLALIWAAFVRKSKRHRKHHYPRARTERTATVESERPKEAKRRKFRRRRESRPRNPTLAETGGLPPVRSGPPESFT